MGSKAELEVVGLCVGETTCGNVPFGGFFGGVFWWSGHFGAGV